MTKFSLGKLQKKKQNLFWVAERLMDIVRGCLYVKCLLFNSISKHFVFLIIYAEIAT